MTTPYYADEPLTAGSLCTGYGGLERGVRRAGFPLDLAWAADTDRSASLLLAHRHPEVPNLGDITGGAVDKLKDERPTFVGNDEKWIEYSDAVMRRMAYEKWRQVSHVALLLAGWPCQGNSLAGLRLGAADERHLWPAVAGCLAAQRPEVFVGENVPGLLTIDNGAGFATVLKDLDNLGYTVAWTTIGACKVGAPHHRHRVFVYAVLGTSGIAAGQPIAWRNDGSGPWVRYESDLFGDFAPFTGWPQAGYMTGGFVWSRPAEVCGATSGVLPTPAARLGDDRGMPSPGLAANRMWDAGRRNLEDAVALLPTPRATDGTKGGPNQRGSSGDLMLPSAVMLLPTPTVADARGTRNATAGRRDGAEFNNGTTLSDVAYADRWGQYAGAIVRWEQVMGRPAPDPTEPGAKGKPRLAPRFVEWMQGLPAGHVTDLMLPDTDPRPERISRSDALRLLGNGVVEEQSAAAVDQLATAPSAVPARAAA